MRVRTDGTCVRCCVGAHDACDCNEPCDCRGAAHRLTESERGVLLAAQVIRLAQDIDLSVSTVVLTARDEVGAALEAGCDPERAVTLRAFYHLLCAVAEGMED